MMRLSEAVAALTAHGARLVGSDVTFTGVSTDSRSVQTGDLFVAITGDKFDGHDYVATAHKAGACAALVSRATNAPVPQVVVDDARRAMGALAAHWRSRFGCIVTAITGSNGKTTVKEMLASILAAHSGDAKHVLATIGNLNNDIGVPQMMFRLRDHHRYAVLEMGMNHRGEIAYLTRLAKPKVAIVNNAQRAHIGELGSAEAIAEAKGEIYQGLDVNGVAIINIDDKYAGYWRTLNQGRRVLTFGFGAADVRGQWDRRALTLFTAQGSCEVALKVPGEHNGKNAVAAAACAIALDVPLSAIQSGLGNYAGSKGRLQIKSGIRGATVIDDTYNANPDSAKAAIRVLAEYPSRRLFVLGDMGELGAYAKEMHVEVGEFARRSQIDGFFGFGNLAAEAVRAFGDGGQHFGEMDDLVAALTRELDSDVTVVVKGSRFMQMERVVDRITRNGDRRAA